MTRRFVPGLVALGFGGFVAVAAFQHPRSELPALALETPEAPPALPALGRPPIGFVGHPLAPEPRPADALIARIGDGRLRHCGHVFRTRFHPNGRWVAATAVGENGVRIWDTHSGEQVRRFTDRDLDPFENTRGNCSVLLFTPDGRLVVGTDDGRVVAFNADTGKVTARFKADGFYTWDLGMSPVGRYVAGFASDHRLAVWNLDTGEQSFTGPKCEGKKVFWSRHGSACFSPDGKHVAVCKTPEVVWYAPLADATVGREVSASAAAGKDGLLNLEWSANNRLVAQGHGGSVLIDTDAGKVLSHDEKGRPAAGPRYVQNEKGTRAVETWSHAVRVIDLTSKVTPDYALPEIHRQPADPLANLFTSADGTRLLTGHGVWDISTDRPKLLRELPSGLDLRDVRLSPDGRFVANTHRGWLHVTDVASGKEVFRENSGTAEGAGVLVSAGSAKANSVWVRDYKTDELREIELPSGKVLNTVAGLRATTYVRASRDGKHQAVGGYESFAIRTTEPKAEWQVLEKYPAVLWQCMPPPPPCPHEFAFHPDGRLFALRDHRLLIWTSSPARMLTAAEQTLERDHQPVALAMSPAGRRLAVVTAPRDATRGEVRVFETATLAEAYRLSPDNGVTACTFTADGRLVVAHRDTTASIWSVERLETNRFRGGDPAKWVDPDPKVGLGAVRALAADPARAVRVLAGFPGGVDRQRVARLIAELGDPNFAVREKASEALAALGADAEASLREAATESKSPEVRDRATRLLRPLIPTDGRRSAAHLRVIRAVEVLEHVGTKEAKELLAKWATDHAGSFLASEAKAALERLGGITRPAK